MRSDVYNLLPCDLNTFSFDLGPSLLEESSSLLDPSIDTLIIAECLLVYLLPEVTNSILKWCASTFSSCVVVGYDPVNFNDAFGRMMVNNLKVYCVQCARISIDPLLQTRGIQLLGSAEHTSVKSQSTRLARVGLEFSGAKSVSEIRKFVVPQEELQRYAPTYFLSLALRRNATQDSTT